VAISSDIIIKFYNMNLKKLLFLFVVSLFVFSVVLAQETTGISSMEADQDEIVSGTDLGVDEPKLLPDSRFYFFKEWGRGIGLFFTFNQVKKGEKLLEHANEKLLEAQKLAEKTENEKIAEKAMEKYEKAMEKAGVKLEGLKEKYQNDSRYQQLVEKFAENGIMHYRVLSNLRYRWENLPEEVKDRLEDKRVKVVQRWGEVLNNIEGDNLVERLERVMQEVDGSRFKDFKNLEILKELEQRLPEEALPGIRRAQENTIQRLEKGIEGVGPRNLAETLQNYLNSVRGDREFYFEALEEVRHVLDDPEAIQQLMMVQERLRLQLPDPSEAEAIMNRVMERVRQKIEESTYIDIDSFEDCIKVYPDVCGDGICQEIVCLADGCPCAESVRLCPQDCQISIERCAGEGKLTSGPVAPEYAYDCCNGLEAFDHNPDHWVGGGLLCYDPSKGTPECKYIGTRSEGWYYSGTDRLIRVDRCGDANRAGNFDD
jgi:hypothetical protein